MVTSLVSSVQLIVTGPSTGQPGNGTIPIAADIAADIAAAKPIV
jgi:hypothetical protein